MEVNSYPVIAVSPTAVTANSVCASQSPAAGAILINGTLAAAGVATIGAAQLIRLTSGGDDSGITFIFTGTDTEGNVQTETVAGTNASNSDTTKYFKTITAITASAAVATTIVVGNLIASVSNIVVPSNNISPMAVGLGVVLVSGTATYKVQHTYQKYKVGANAHPSVWFDNSAGAKTASSEATYSTPVAAIRVLVTASSSGVINANVVQAG